MVALKMLVRALVKDDIDQIIGFSLAPNEPDWSKKALLDALHGISDGTYVANVGVDETTGQVVGLAIASYIFDQADVQHVVVDQPFRGQGFGRQLLQSLIKGLLVRAVATVFLEVRPSNQVAVALYQSMGFECIQKRRDYYPGVDGVREDALVFSLRYLV
jgi:ribosomal-protein-alanine N-acetyltransferase